MAQRHLDRLTGLDSSFLHLEGPQTHMHIGALALCEGPPPPLDQLLAHVGRGCTWRRATASGSRTRRSTAAARCGSTTRASASTSTSATRRCRRRAAATSSTSSLAPCLLRRARSQPAAVGAVVRRGARGRSLRAAVQVPPRDDRRHRRRRPRDRRLRPSSASPRHCRARCHHGAPHRRPDRSNCSRSVPAGSSAAARRSRGRRSPGRSSPAGALARARAALEGVGEVVWEALTPAPRTPLNVPIGPHRRFATASCRRSEFKAIQDALGGTVNDVVLAVVTGALRRFLAGRSIRTEGLELRALVPISIRSPGAPGELGNRLAAVRAPLPVHIGDPAARLAAVRAEHGCDQGLAPGARRGGPRRRAGLRAAGTARAGASRLNLATRLFNLLVTNVPGPRTPLYVLGRAHDRGLPDRVPAARPGARGRDPVLRRPGQLRPARRPRRAAGARPVRRLGPSGGRRARQAGGGAA